jgi:hypothetical protein
VSLGREEFRWLDDDEALRGTLISPTADGGGYIILFPFTRKGMRRLREGLLAAARSFLSEREKAVYSILELTKGCVQHP